MTSTRNINKRGRTLRQHAARGTMINAAFLIGLSGLGLVRGFVLAAFLTAAEYGVWGILVVSLGTIMWLKQVGIGDKYIQQDEEDQEVAFQKAFTLEAIFTGIFMLVLLAAMPVIVIAYGEDRLLAPGLVLILLLPANVLQTPLWVYYRNMEFLRQRLLQSAEPVVGFIVAVGMAVAGAGYWALAVGVLAGAYSAALLALLFAPYKLRFRYDGGTLREYASFSWPLLISNASSLVIAQGSLLATNAKVGLAGAGALTLTAQITAFTDRVDGLVTGTLYPAICAVRDRMDLLYESFVKSNRITLMWAFPFGTGISLFASDLVDFVIGDEWRSAVELLQVIGLVAAFGHIAFNWDAYMRALDRTRPMAVSGFVAMLAFVTAGIPLIFAYGLKGLAAGIGIQAAAHVACRAYFMRKLFDGFGFLAHAARAALPAVVAAAVILGLRAVDAGSRTGVHALAELVMYVCATVVATWLIEGRLLREAFGYLAARRGAPA